MVEPYIIKRGGKEYMYRATSHYSTKKRGPVAETEYMGIVIDGKLRPKRGFFYNEETKEFGPIAEDATAAKGAVALYTKRYGNVHLLMGLQKRLKILDDLQRSFGKDLGDRIMATVLAYTIQPSALMHMESVMEQSCVREVLGLDPDEDFSSPRMSEITSTIGNSTDSMDEFFRRRITGSDGEFVFDLTSETTYSSKNTMAEWGRNKDNLKVKQINLGLVTDKKGRPLMFYLYPGSVADVTTIDRLIEDIRRYGKNEPTLVMDRGFVSPRSVMHLLESKIDFVMPMIVGDNSVVKALVTEALSVVGNVKNIVVHGEKSYSVISKQLGIRRNRGGNIGKRATVWEDPDGYDLLSQDDAEFGSCDDYLDVHVFRDVGAAGLETSKLDVSLNNIITRLDGTRPRDPEKHIAAVAGKLANMLEYEMDDEHGLKLSIKQNAHTFAVNRKGIFIMISPASSHRSCQDVLRCYECRDKVEDVFLEDKVAGDGRTPGSGDRKTIVGRTFIRMVSMIMVMEMINRISEVAKDNQIRPENKPRDIAKRSPISLLDSLSNLEIIYGNGWKQMTEVTKDNRLIFRMFDIGPPKGREFL